MNYQESLDYLFSRINQGIKLGLENTARLLDHFDNPQLKIPTLHIAGTNGKGSTAAFIESILRASGYRTGLFTSPHFLDYRERIQIDRQLIAQDELAHWLTSIKKASESLDIGPTYFEIGTVLAFLYFENRKTDWNVIEVGMGGRLDATNLCQGRVCVITSISRDHESSLGSDLVGIAGEKAAIIKHPCTVICGPNDRAVVNVVEEQCRVHGATLLRSGEDYQVTGKSYSPQGQVFDFNNAEIWYKGLEISLLGEHQAQNAGLAITACLALAGAPITEPVIRKALKSAHWPGRLELCGSHPAIILDVAHNPDSFIKLTTSLSELFPQQRKIWVLGLMADKPLKEITSIISDYADTIIATQPRNERSASPAQILDNLTDYSKPIESYPQVPLALDRALQVATPDDLIVVTGSFYTVAEAKQFIENQTFNS